MSLMKFNYISCKYKLFWLLLLTPVRIPAIFKLIKKKFHCYISYFIPDDMRKYDYKYHF
jgi:hypothetical protein